MGRIGSEEFVLNILHISMEGNIFSIPEEELQGEYFWISTTCLFVFFVEGRSGLLH
jgi:hypothetical protein